MLASSNHSPSHASMPELVLNTATLGAIEIGVVVAAILNGVLILQVGRYFHKSGKDPSFLKLIIFVTWLATVTHLIIAASSLYFTTVLQHEEPIPSTVLHLSFSFTISVGAVIHTSVQAIYAYRLFRGSAVAYTVMGTRAASSPRRSTLEWWNWIFVSELSVAAAADVFMSFFTWWYLTRICDGSIKKTQRLINRAVLRVVQVGIATSILSICTAIVCAVCQPRAIWMGLYFPLVPLHPVTLLALLNDRASTNKRPESPSSKDQAIEIVVEQADFSKESSVVTMAPPA
ncbi:hypothetical protein BD779DRAFT_566803 [Infundibulicybe gibba]|nr:hypothetical protein BD779DRAFT_566803 [Infundibulicybe gibba]